MWASPNSSREYIYILNIEKLKRLTGFTIQTTIQEGIVKEIKRIKKEQGGIRK